MLVLEALPLIFFKPPELPSSLVNRIMASSFEYYVNQMCKDNTDSVIVADCWKKIFEVLEMCTRVLKWETFLPYNKSVSKDIYWQKLIQIVSSAPPRPSENKQILFCATILFVMSLQEYVSNVRVKVDGVEVEYILVEGFKNDSTLDSKRRKSDSSSMPPYISVCAPCIKETPICLVTAAQCWQLLHSNEILQIDFSQLLLTVPLSTWINRFLIDLAVYVERTDEARTLLKDTNITNLEMNLRLMSLTVMQPNFNVIYFLQTYRIEVF